MAEPARRTDGTIINIRAHRYQRNLIDRASNALGKTRSEFMLETACRAAEDVLLDTRLFMLDDDAYARFVAALDAPPQPSTALKSLLVTKAPWE